MSQELEIKARAVPGGIPVLGHVLGFAVWPLKFLDEQRELADITAINLGPKQARIVNNPTLVRELLVSRTKDFIKAGPLYDISSAFVGNGLAISEGAFHRRQRRLMQPAFQRSRMPAYHSGMREAAEQMTARWRSGQAVDVHKDLFQLAVSVIGNMLYEGRFTDEMTDRIVWAVSTASKGIGWRSVVPAAWTHTLPTEEFRRFTRAQQALHGLGDHVVAEYRERDDTDPEHFLSMLLAARDENGDPLSDKELRDEVVTLFSAGSATVATSLAWALHLLSIHPDVEERLFTEVTEVLAGRPVTVADLPRLEYLGRVVTEVLRLYPPAWLLPRITPADTELGGHPIPKGTYVFFSPYSIHHDARLYPDPEHFDPDRWLPERSASRPREAYLPFGAGIHQCIGNNFALTEATIALATIVAKWRLRRPPRAKVGTRSAALLEPVGLTLVAKRRAGRTPAVAASAPAVESPGCPVTAARPAADA
ncbi:cytochrome P450 [Streptomyces sp. CB01881]|uniref:cytochrome P450 n=1 Tax=Streptomyces sp. CB01881 TaxID=2078691 RepID=UPI000CDCC643|nr:cytochrome P450 [Streptomyces sp. CB01881]AUY53115.1 cytochrome P450 [Streptomyces sp. CB01881]TYC69267.1 cytochrome P450 [Streptomyces sp. CB01881]